jgi:hypothetical protein
MDIERDRLLTTRMRRFYETNGVMKPVQTPKPQVLAAPPSAPIAVPNTLDS